MLDPYQPDQPGQPEQPEQPADIAEQLASLRQVLKRLQPGLIAVSGGVDSRFLAHAARSWGLDYQLAFAAGPHQTCLERRQTLAWLNAQGIPAHLIDFDPLRIPGLWNNPPRRCYLCKRALFSHLRALAAKVGMRTVLDGSQADDLHDHRPGLQASRELDVHSPLAVACMGKAAVRLAARQFGLSEPDQPSRACLLTRFPYGFGIAGQLLESVGRVEDGLRALGLRRFRFRVLDEGAYLLQVHHREWNVWTAVAGSAGRLIAEHGLAPFEVMETRQLSGFFDKESI